MTEHVEYHVSRAGKGVNSKITVMELTRSAERGPVTGSRILAEVYDEADAQRIVACLGSLQRLPIEAITHAALGDAYADVAHQRDALLLAATKLEDRDWFMASRVHDEGTLGDMAEMRRALKLARGVKQ